MKNRKILSLFVLVMVVALCFSLGACSDSESTGNTTAPAETQKAETTENITETETEPEAIAQVIETKYFSLTAPKEWDNKFSYEIRTIEETGAYIIDFQHDKSYEDDFGGLLFSVEVHNEDENYAADMKEFSPAPFDFVGVLDVKDEGKFEVLVTYPSDKQYSSEYEDEYKSIVDDVDDLLDSMKTINGAEYKKN